MVSHRKLIPIAMTLAILVPTVVHAQAWTLDEGAWEISFDTVYTQFDRVKLFDDSTGRPGDVTFISLGLGAEYGVFDRLTVSALVPYESSTRDGTAAGPPLNLRQTESGLGDGRFGARFRILDEWDDQPLTVSAGATVKVPLSNYDENLLHSFGDGQVDFDLYVSGGKVFDETLLSPSLMGTVGYRWRLDDPNDEFFFFGQIGAQVTERIGARVFVDAIESRGGLGLESPQFGAIAAAEGKPPFPAVEEDIVKLGVGTTIALKEDVDLELFVARTVEAENTSVDTVFGVGFRFSF